MKKKVRTEIHEVKAIYYLRAASAFPAFFILLRASYSFQKDIELI
jgi:hypothetical protein